MGGINRAILVKFGEIALKSPSVRRKMLGKLVDNLSNAFENRRMECVIERLWDRIVIYPSDMDGAISVLKKTFGVSIISPCVICSSEIKELTQCVVNYARSVEHNSPIINKKLSFALRVRRTSYPLSSRELANLLGDAVRRETNWEVNLTVPDVEIFVEVVAKKAYIYREKIRGAGGLPVGVQGRVIIPIQRIKDLSAAWLLMKRGCSPVIIAYKDFIEENGKYIEKLREWGEIDVIPLLGVGHRDKCAENNVSWGNTKSKGKENYGMNGDGQNCCEDDDLGKINGIDIIFRAVELARRKGIPAIALGLTYP
ncbi:MAG: hypothetical protein DRN20_05950, partial [Thermoplasmata archaeon]